MRKLMSDVTKNVIRQDSAEIAEAAIRPERARGLSCHNKLCVLFTSGMIKAIHLKNIQPVVFNWERESWTIHFLSAINCASYEASGIFPSGTWQS
jgi:hypothetical protein